MASLVSAKSLVLVTIILVVVLFIIGVFEWKKRPYDCYVQDRYTWGEKVEVLAIGSFHAYAYPLVKTCPVEQQYDPNNYEENVLTNTRAH